ncbi:phosphoribosylglycinamide formyltransferase [Kitasatospora sp. MMS16-BH015]|uniref:phosphoribosylglycinamide formyltransferase n=1 Tax=Kitasatospora sp. MMS16-BH015 TaxID=2018025 RepID=UPI000CA3F159|nr:phosphoribosylglycinamide formyltransferase [Kitasatospora sp. MMS16-BH015]AUG80656.1 phosphoribosylglycinamide formyltransferase [Kitasatospora sp. MMS16-BH015]
MSFKVAVLASHHGSNLRALTAAAARPESAFEVALVVSNNSASGALVHARELDIPWLHLSGRTHPDPEQLDLALLAALTDRHVDLVVTAGYLRKIGPFTLSGYGGRIVNVHPSLLPRHGGPGMHGLHVHESVLAAGDTVSGASVHQVTADYDEGPVIARREVPVLPTDTVETLAARVLTAEHALLAETVQALAIAHADH